MQIGLIFQVYAPALCFVTFIPLIARFSLITFPYRSASYLLSSSSSPTSSSSFSSSSPYFRPALTSSSTRLTLSSTFPFLVLTLQQDLFTRIESCCLTPRSSPFLHDTLSPFLYSLAMSMSFFASVSLSLCVFFFV